MNIESIIIGLVLLINLPTTIAISIIYPQNQVFIANLYPKLPTTSYYNVSVLHAQNGTCDSFPLANEEQQVLFVPGDLLCFPHVASQNAANLGFVAILFPYKSAFHNISRLNFWNSRNGAIPVYRTAEEDIDWNNVERITLEEDNPNNIIDTEFAVQILIISIVNTVIAVGKLYNAVLRLKTFWSSGFRISPIITVLILEALNSVITIIWFVDPYGIRGYYPYWFMFLLIRIAGFFSFYTTYLLWLSIVFVRNSVRTTQPSLKERVKRRLADLIVVVGLVIALLMTYLVGIIGNAPFILLSADFLFIGFCQILMGYGFMKNKYNVLMQLKNGTKGLKQDKERNERIRKSSFYLSISAVFMLITLVLLILFSLGIADSPFQWYMISLLSFTYTVVGYFQVLSVIVFERKKKRKTRLRLFPSILSGYSKKSAKDSIHSGLPISQKQSGNVSEQQEAKISPLNIAVRS